MEDMTNRMGNMQMGDPPHEQDDDDDSVRVDPMVRSTRCRFIKGTPRQLVWHRTISMIVDYSNVSDVALNQEKFNDAMLQCQVKHQESMMHSIAQKAVFSAVGKKLRSEAKDGREKAKREASVHGKRIGKTLAGHFVQSTLGQITHEITSRESKLLEFIVAKNKKPAQDQQETTVVIEEVEDITPEHKRQSFFEESVRVVVTRCAKCGSVGHLARDCPSYSKHPIPHKSIRQMGFYIAQDVPDNLTEDPATHDMIYKCFTVPPQVVEQVIGGIKAEMFEDYETAKRLFEEDHQGLQSIEMVFIVEGVKLQLPIVSFDQYLMCLIVDGFLTIEDETLKEKIDTLNAFLET